MEWYSPSVAALTWLVVVLLSFSDVPRLVAMARGRTDVDGNPVVPLAPPVAGNGLTTQPEGRKIDVS